jgi:hypothetical protein
MAIVLEKVRVSYVNLVKPKANLSNALKYSVQIQIEKTDKKNIAKIEKALEAAIKKGVATIWSGKKPSFRFKPLRDGDAELESGEQTNKDLKGMYFLSASKDPSFGPVGLVDENLQVVVDPGKIYSGCYCNVQVNPYPYDRGGNKGVGWGIANVMFVCDGDRLDGQESPTDAFASLAPNTEKEANECF